jgi:hypothetical protein
MSRWLVPPLQQPRPRSLGTTVVVLTDRIYCSRRFPYIPLKSSAMAFVLLYVAYIQVIVKGQNNVGKKMQNILGD